MGVFQQFPYTNFHEMNLDEIIRIVKDMVDRWAQYYTEWDDWKEQVTQEWAEMQQFINDYFDNLDVQQEINNKINSMVTSGEFAAIVDPFVPPAASAWLAEHITQPTTPAIDTSLSVAGAAADAKAAGDEIQGIKKSFISYSQYFIGVENPVANLTWTEGYTITDNGSLEVNNAFHYSKLIPFDNEETYLFIWDSEIDGFISIHGYDDNGNWIEQVDKFASGIAEGASKVLNNASSTVTQIRISLKIRTVPLALCDEISINDQVKQLGAFTVNLADLSNSGSYIGSNGEIVTTSLPFASSNLIPVFNLSSVQIIRSPRITNACSVAFYSENEFSSSSFISGYGENRVVTNETIDVPEGTKYIAFSSRTNEGIFEVKLLFSNLIKLIQDIATEFDEQLGYPHEGEMLSILGDSISTYQGYCPEGNRNFYPQSWFTGVGNTWWDKLIHATKMNLLVNNSSSGSHMATNDPLSGLSRCADLDNGIDTPDHIIILMGINDFVNGNGVIGECGLNPVTYSIDNYSDAYYTALNTIKIKYPNAKLYLGTIIQYSLDATFPNKEHNKYLTEFNDAIRKLADIYGATVIEFTKCGIDYFNAGSTLGDSLHPNILGHELMFREALKQFK